jgi:hypothetical protein
MNLGEFHAEIKASLARGDSLDAIIPGYTRRAALWMERNYTFQYMKQFLEVDIDPTLASTPRYIELGPGAPKAIPMFRWVLGDGTYMPLTKVDPLRLDALEVSTPESYWLDGTRRIILSSTPGEVLHGELRIDRYTPWPAELTFTHWLLDRAEDVMLAQTLIMMSIHLRDPRLRDNYKQMRDEGMLTLLNAEDELQYGNQDGAMEYRPQV